MIQGRNRWIFLLMGCAVVASSLFRLFQAEYTVLFS